MFSKSIRSTTFLLDVIIIRRSPSIGFRSLKGILKNLNAITELSRDWSEWAEEERHIINVYENVMKVKKKTEECDECDDWYNYWTRRYQNNTSEMLTVRVFTYIAMTKTSLRDFFFVLCSIYMILTMFEFAWLTSQFARFRFLSYSTMLKKRHCRRFWYDLDRNSNFSLWKTNIFIDRSKSKESIATFNWSNS